MNREPGKSARILVTGDNFGCGSSREHAPWAIAQAGISVVIARSFADIFRSNSQKNGLLLIALDAEAHSALIKTIEADGSGILTVDLPAQRAEYGGLRLDFSIDAFYKMCLIEGIDDFGYLLKHADAIRAYEEKNGKL